jgi:hypothetical protein
VDSGKERRGWGWSGTNLSVVWSALGCAGRSVIGVAGNAPPLAIVRSRAYFLPVVEEVLEMEVGEQYFQYVRQKLKQLRPS